MTAPALGARPDALHTRLDDAIDRAQVRALRMQHADGYWHAPLEACVGMDAQYIICNRFLGRRPAEREQRLVANILARQSTDGSWNLYDGGPGHVSTTIEAYFAMKLAGLPAEHPAMRRAREWILAHGGLAKAGVFTRFFLAHFGEYPRRAACQRSRSSWCCCRRGSRSTSTRCRAGRARRVVPLTILAALQPRVPLAPEHRVPELWVRPPTAADLAFPRGASLVSWENAFLVHRRRPEGSSGASRGSRSAPARFAAREAWILERQEPDGGWGGIQPPMINCVMALRALGYPDDHPALRKGIEAIENFVVEHDGRMFFQPCVSPTWDTALMAKALLDAGMPGDHPALVRAADWLIDRQILATGRLERVQSRSRAGRLGLRVRERLVSRRRRQRGHPDGLAAHPGHRSDPPAPRDRHRTRPGRSACRAATAGGARSTRTTLRPF